MQPISFKKLVIAILIVIAMSKIDRISAFASAVYQFFYDSFEGLRTSPARGRLAVATLILALLYISIYKLLYEKIRKR